MAPILGRAERLVVDIVVAAAVVAAGARAAQIQAQAQARVEAVVAQMRNVAVVAAKVEAGVGGVNLCHRVADLEKVAVAAEGVQVVASRPAKAQWRLSPLWRVAHLTCRQVASPTGVCRCRRRVR